MQKSGSKGVLIDAFRDMCSLWEDLCRIMIGQLELDVDKCPHVSGIIHMAVKWPLVKR
jgi:hypothetical protein